MLLFPLFYLIFTVYQEIDIVEAVHQTVLLVGVNVEMLAPASSHIGDSLVRQVDLNLGLGVVLNGQKQFGQEGLADLHRQYEVVEFVILVDVGKK